MSEATRQGMREAGQPPSDRSRYDVAVLGAGPAGLLLAREIAANGLSVIVVSPRTRRALSASYGLWRDEAEAGGILDCLESIWPTATVRISDERAHVLSRPYARVDGAKLQEKLRAQALARGVRFLEDAADELGHDAEGSTVKLETGGEVKARLVVDCSGHSTRLLARRRDERPALQMAYGLFLEDAVLPFDEESAMLMDLRAASPGAHEEQPSFLYAVRRPDGCALARETSLVGTPPVPEKVLEERLRRRMRSFGIRGRERGVEISCLPLGRPLPDDDQRVLGFGAAGGLVHPVTGNMLGGMLTRAAPLAREIARFYLDGVPAERLGRCAWRALWPEQRRAAREQLLSVMDLLRGLDGHGLRELFDGYFTVAGPEWPALFAFDQSADELAAVLGRVLETYPFSLRLRASLLRALRHGRPRIRRGRAPPSSPAPRPS